MYRTQPPGGITGPNSICTYRSTQYTTGYGANHVWTASPSSFVVSSSGYSATVQATAAASGFLKVTYNRLCDNALVTHTTGLYASFCGATMAIAPNPVADVAEISYPDEEYWVEITNRCSSTADTANLVFIRQDVGAFIPNVFTPNGDGYNDTFELHVLNTPAYSLTIVNRWGKQVYYSRNPFGYWDGRVNGGDEAAPGMYCWRVTATDCRNQPISYKGFVSILR